MNRHGLWCGLDLDNRRSKFVKGPGEACLSGVNDEDGAAVNDRGGDGDRGGKYGNAGG